MTQHILHRLQECMLKSSISTSVLCCRRAQGATLVALLLMSSSALSVDAAKRSLRITTKQEASVVWYSKEGEHHETTPLTNQFEIDPKKPLELTVQPTSDDYFPTKLEIYYTNTQPRAIWATNVDLVRRQYKVPIRLLPNPTDSKVVVESGNGTSTSREGEQARDIIFSRPTPDDTAWTSVQVSFLRTNFDTIKRTLQLKDIPLTIKEILDAGGVPAPWEIKADLVENTRWVIADIAVDAPEVDLLVEGVPGGKTGVITNGLSSGAQVLQFRRNIASGGFVPKSLRLQKKDWVIQVGDGPFKPYLSVTIDPESPSSRTNIVLRGFKESPFVVTPFPVWDTSGRELRHSAIPRAQSQRAGGGPIAPGSAGDDWSPKTEEGRTLVAGRLAVVPEGNELIYALPSGEGGRSLIGSHRKAAAQINYKLMDDENAHQPADPFVSDGQLYFSAVYDGIRYIMTRSLEKGIPDHFEFQNRGNYSDTEPAVAPGTRDNPVIAFTRRSTSGSGSAQPFIMIVSRNGSMNHRLDRGSGHSPAWAPKGGRIAYIGANEQLMLSLDDGAAPRRLTTEKQPASSPVWTTNGRFIIFAMQRRIQTEGSESAEVLASDIWMIDLEGDRKPLVQDGSYNAFPALSSDGRVLFYFSNQGASGSGDDKAMKIMKMPLPSESYSD